MENTRHRRALLLSALVIAALLEYATYTVLTAAISSRSVRGAVERRLTAVSAVGSATAPLRRAAPALATPPARSSSAAPARTPSPPPGTGTIPLKDAISTSFDFDGEVLNPSVGTQDLIFPRKSSSFTVVPDMRIAYGRDKQWGDYVMLTQIMWSPKPYDNTTRTDCLAALQAAPKDPKTSIPLWAGGGVCFVTMSGLMGKVSDAGPNRDAVRYEIWRAAPISAIAPGPGTTGERLGTLMPANVIRYDFSEDKNLPDGDPAADMLIKRDYNNSRSLITVAQLRRNPIALITSDRTFTATDKEHCRQRLKNTAAIWLEGELPLWDADRAVCFQTKDGWMGKIGNISRGAFTLEFAAWKIPIPQRLPPQTIVLKKAAGSAGNEYAFLRYEPGADKQTFQRQCKKKKVLGVTYEKNCKNVPVPVATTNLRALPGVKLVPLGPGTSFEKLTEETCAHMVITSYGGAPEIPDVTGANVACISESDGRVGKVGNATPTSVTIFLW